MRRAHKYKIYSRVQVNSKFPKRLLNLKRPKWNSLKKKLKFVLARKENFKIINPNMILGRTFGWKRLRKTYKSRLEFYSSLFARFDQSLKIRRLKSYKTLIRFDNYVKHLAEGYFKVTVLLWSTHFFKSSFEAKQQIDFLNIFLNNEKIQSNKLLTAGSVVSIVNDKFVFLENLNKYSDNNQILSFVEIDYYSQNLVLLKSVDEVSDNDLSLLLIDSLGLSNF